MQKNSTKYASMTKLQYFRHKYLSSKFVVQFLWVLLRTFLLAGISFIILYPFFLQIVTSLMTEADMLDKTVLLIPKELSLDNYRRVIQETEYWQAFLNNFTMSLLSALLQSMVAVCVGYGLAKFKFRGRSLILAAVVFVLMVPPSVVLAPLYLQFHNFDILWIFRLILGHPIKTIDTFWPMIILSSTGLAVKNGLFIFVMRQSFMGLPDELLEAAYIDGSGVYRTFGKIILPLCVSQIVTIFLLAFSWMWTDSFYSPIFYPNLKFLPNIITLINSKYTAWVTQVNEYSLQVFMNVGLLLIIIPLVVMYLFVQRFITQGIERSGLTG